LTDWISLALFVAVTAGVSLRWAVSAFESPQSVARLEALYGDVVVSTMRALIDSTGGWETAFGIVAFCAALLTAGAVLAGLVLPRARDRIRFLGGPLVMGCGTVIVVMAIMGWVDRPLPPTFVPRLQALEIPFEFISIIVRDLGTTSVGSGLLLTLVGGVLMVALGALKTASRARSAVGCLPAPGMGR
jgi:hypothetical protein